MKLQGKYRVIIINILIAVGISLIVNFSHIVFLMMAPLGGYGGGGGGRWMQQQNTLLWLQFLYNMVLGFILLSVATIKLPRDDGMSTVMVRRILTCILITFLFYFIAPRTNREGDIIINLYARRLFDPNLLLKVSFTLIVAVLYGVIYELIYQKQRITLENEVLKNENLKTTYNALVNQINPHFFFNSLNSLSMLVRENRNDNALLYIDRLSNTFRYIIQNGHTGITTLEDEMKFVDSYKYLHEIRYADKLFFEISIDERLCKWSIPSLTLQPLIENAIKHNTITKASPLTVKIFTDGNDLMVTNPIKPKLGESDGTGIGLENLKARYILLTHKEIHISMENNIFAVRLPLISPENESRDHRG